MQKVLTTLSFIGGRLRQPGERIDYDDENENLVIPASSTPLANLSTEELEAYLRAKRRAEGGSSNVADPTDQNTGRVEVPLADITVRSPGTTAPQGAPPGSADHNGTFVQPTAPEADGALAAFTGQPGASAALPTIGSMDGDGDGKPGGTLTDAELDKALKARKDITVPKDATRAQKLSLLAQPPKA